MEQASMKMNSFKTNIYLNIQRAAWLAKDAVALQVANEILCEELPTLVESSAPHVEPADATPS